MTATETHRVIDAVWRMESAKLIAGLARIVRDVGLAEDLAQDALLAALERWPESGIPDNPGAWLMATAKHRSIDQIRRRAMLERKHDQLGHELAALQEAAVPEPTMAQRIVRAKRTLADSRVPFEVPRGAEFEARLASVLQVVYLVFNEGYSATAGEEWLRPALCEDALRLGRILAELTPREPEVHGLVALMEIQASRSAARVEPSGEPVLLLDQDRARWDQLLIRRGLAALALAESLAEARGSYTLQAAIAACHARARTADETDWHRIAELYQKLGEITRSPIVELNRAVAVSMAFGPQFGLDIVDALRSEPSLAGYHLLPAVRADLLIKLGRTAEARTELERAAAMTRNERERVLLTERAERLG